MKARPGVKEVTMGVYLFVTKMSSRSGERGSSAKSTDGTHIKTVPRGGERSKRRISVHLIF